MRTRIVIILSVAAAIAVTASAQHQVRQYAAKFVCGTTGLPQATAYNFAPGTYFSTINVHNPALATSTQFQKKFALAETGEQPGKIFGWFPAVLKADETMQIDCANIFKHLGITHPGATLIEGFVIIQLPPTRELDVVGVYTAAGNAGVSAMHMERVAGRITQ